MRKNKFSDILFGLLLFGFLVSNLTGCGSTPTPASAPAYPPSTARQTENDQETHEEVASQETEESSAAQEVEENEGEPETAELPESIVFTGPEDKNCTSYVIPDGVTVIGEEAFYECDSLTTVEIPDSVVEIGERAFQRCSSLAVVEIPDSVTQIDNWAFSQCDSLTTVKIPDSVVEMGESAFYGCSSLISVEIPDGVVKIGKSAFFGCSSLTTVEIPNSVTEIGDFAFFYCDSLVSVRLPENLDVDLETVFDMGYNTDIQFAYGDEIGSETDIALTESAVGSDIESIKSVCGILAPVETDIAACHWDSYGEHPYDVVYNYGVKYMAYVDACDWSLVFDADYYMDTFPMLALQYHYDKDELLFHFQTIGIHEGRQGSADFNVYCYAMNSDIGLAFDSYEGYYLYYMLNYDTEKEVNTVTTEDMSGIQTMYEFHPTAMQQAELEAVNADREEVGVDELSMSSEICALAGYRAYINAHDGYNGHTWAEENMDLLASYCKTAGLTRSFSENTVTTYARNVMGKVEEPNYYASQSHYDAMVDPKYNYIGVSNMCNGESYSSQFDFFMDTVN